MSEETSTAPRPTFLRENQLIFLSKNWLTIWSHGEGINLVEAFFFIRIVLAIGIVIAHPSTGNTRLSVSFIWCLIVAFPTPVVPPVFADLLCNIMFMKGFDWRRFTIVRPMKLSEILDCCGIIFKPAMCKLSIKRKRISRGKHIKHSSVQSNFFAFEQTILNSNFSVDSCLATCFQKWYIYWLEDGFW